MRFDTQKDFEIVDSVIAGDSKAFDKLFSTYYSYILALTTSMLHNVEDAEDLTQQVFLSAYRQLGYFRKESSLATWLVSIAKNKVVSSSRKNRLSVINLDELRNVLDSMDVYDTYCKHQESSKIAVAISELSPRLKNSFILFTVMGYSQQEVAAMLDCPVGTVKSRVSRAGEQLTKSLSSEFPS